MKPNKTELGIWGGIAFLCILVFSLMPKRKRAVKVESKPQKQDEADADIEARKKLARELGRAGGKKSAAARKAKKEAAAAAKAEEAGDDAA